MFDKILIANRGEIACRIIETARKLGVKTVAIYSDADAKARHVDLADEAIHIGPSPAIESYLRIDKVIEAARATGAQAIHPGYGFLSENPEFVQACEDAGLVFIGPTAQAIRAMGLKDAAKALMQKAGVPVVPGYHGERQEPDFLKEQADHIGYPVLIKAVAGGGGKGMRLVASGNEFAQALGAAQAEAKAAFGNSVVLIEKYISNPRHIEVQVFGDGNDVVHLFERDCSLQRRHQKVIEEAPAPGMNASMRSAMCDAAVRAALAIGYRGAGTIEFIVDGSSDLHPDGFWFMEMNTRLQVEHPVTEAITGIDLVEWQLLVASGGSIPMAQADIGINGHAFEARLYAEDVPAGFLPATGCLAHLHFPSDARIDTGVRPGDEISPHYDPMVAKITTKGANRELALNALHQALCATQIAGTVTNRDFLVRLVEDQDFQSGKVDTGLIGRKLDALIACAVPSTDEVARAALFAIDHIAIAQPFAGFGLWGQAHQQLHLGIGDTSYEIEFASKSPGEVEIFLGQETFVATRNGHDWLIDGEIVQGMRDQDDIYIFGTTTHKFRHSDPLETASQAGETLDGILSPMPGLVRDIFVEVGQNVSKGDRLAILEAMKMEHSLSAPRDGIIAKTLAAKGDQIEAQVLMIELEPET